MTTKKKQAKTKKKSGALIKDTFFSVEMKQSDELDELFKKLSSLTSGAEDILREVGNVFGGDDPDYHSLFAQHPEFLKWIEQHKTFFNVSGYLVAAPFVDIRRILEEAIKDYAVDPEEEIEDLKGEIFDLEANLESKKQQLQKLKNEVKRKK